MLKRRRHTLAPGTLVPIIIGLALTSGCGSSSSLASSPACSISYQDIEIHLSSGDVSCAQVAQQRAGVGELWQTGGIANTSSIPDPPQTACMLAQNGQTATISYGSTLGDATEAELICTDFTGEGWTQQ